MRVLQAGERRTVVVGMSLCELLLHFKYNYDIHLKMLGGLTCMGQNEERQPLKGSADVSGRLKGHKKMERSSVMRAVGVL